MNLFYSPHIKGDTLELDEKESKHSIRVLRLRAGNRVNLVDGKGGWYDAVIEDDHPKRCRLKILSHTPDHHPLPYTLHLAISPTRNMDRFEWFLEKATEIGISEITPLICQRTERTRFNTERLERIIISAMKQSLRAYKPVLLEPSTPADFLHRDRGGTKGIAHCIPDNRTGVTGTENLTGRANSTEQENLTGSAASTGQENLPERAGITGLPHNSNYTLLVGPEGDFSREEVKMALDAGYIPFHLGNSRLRTETAGVYICAAISLRPASL